jgi:hypothetical protein
MARRAAQPQAAPQTPTNPADRCNRLHGAAVLLLQAVEGVLRLARDPATTLLPGSRGRIQQASKSLLDRLADFQARLAEFKNAAATDLLVYLAPASPAQAQWANHNCPSATELVRTVARCLDAVFRQVTGTSAFSPAPSAAAVAQQWQATCQALQAHLAEPLPVRPLNQAIDLEMANLQKLLEHDAKLSAAGTAGNRSEEAELQQARKAMIERFKDPPPDSRDPGRPPQNGSLPDYAQRLRALDPKITCSAILKRLEQDDPGHPILKNKDPVGALRAALRRTRKKRNHGS